MHGYDSLVCDPFVTNERKPHVHVHTTQQMGPRCYNVLGTSCPQAYISTDVGVAEFGVVINFSIVITTSLHLALETMHWVCVLCGLCTGYVCCVDYALGMCAV